MEIQKLQKSDWFDSLIEECRAIIVEHEFTSRWAVIEGYHALGKRISEDNNNFEREQIYGKKIVQSIAETIGKSERTVYQAIKFYEKYPDLSLLPEEKNTSWHKITQKYLSAPKEELKSELLSENEITPPNEFEPGEPPIIGTTWSERLALWEIVIKDEDMKRINVIGVRTKIDEYLNNL